MGEGRRKRTPGRTQPSENSGYAPAVCQTITSETLLYEFFAHRLGLYFHRIRVKSVYKGHRVTGAKEVAKFACSSIDQKFSLVLARRRHQRVVPPQIRRQSRHACLFLCIRAVPALRDGSTCVNLVDDSNKKATCIHFYVAIKSSQNKENRIAK